MRGYAPFFLCLDALRCCFWAAIVNMREKVARGAPRLVGGGAVAFMRVGDTMRAKSIRQRYNAGEINHADDQADNSCE